MGIDPGEWSQLRSLAGKVFGNVSCSGVLLLASGATLTGDIRAKRFAMQEGAVLNGQCVMRPPAQQSVAK